MYWQDGEVYRRVTEAGRQGYEALRQSGLYDALVKRRLLVPHAEQAVPAGAADTAYILKPARVPFISYPYEWAFSALQDAALATLEAQRLALEHGLTMKDASAYNVQFLDGRPVLIDTLSFEPYGGQPAWQAYAQFCRHFLAPLALMSQVDVRLGGLLRNYIDGVPLDLTAALLPLRSKARPGLLLHLALHNASQQRYAHRAQPAATAAAPSALGKQSLLGLLDSLTRTVRKLRLPRRLSTEWGEYYTFTNYSDAASRHKAEVVAEFVKLAQPRRVWDLGGNDGRFSRVALEAGAGQALCFDVDPVAVEKSYRQLRRHPEPRLLPLLADLTNPSPALGWAQQERQGLTERAQPGTTIMALALVHHLAISNNLPFDHIAAWLARLGDHLIIEFIPKTDSKVQILLATRKDIFHQYDQANFETSFQKHFEIVTHTPVEGSQRVMYLMQARHGE
ncbi:MAG TPA: class I SAM-dependent methyltransferase [Candidatus Saccharimonadia bacterium]